jgi:hypothetical protein
MSDKHWERLHGFISEHPIDARYILRDPDNDKAWGSLRVIGYDPSMGILPPGYLKAYASFVTHRRPKSHEEIEQSLNDYQMESIELEVYSVDEHVTTEDMTHQAPKREIEEIYGIKIFGK